ncbi:hypothetical protein [Neorhizobium sp. JUb45]|uniref:hypothetical protein n=1 Tax=Neorhizobium sp. JUb45 TaxID=2485113 RepID=UPI001048047F|nr:hypothetical protein [Neorhizobium sp. JUb45]TCQ95057.1 hypothetical protein EDF70_1269 [Neorhizobium sp. JUb45]
MIDDQNDLGSDASRTDPETADRAREKLARGAERGIEKAMSGEASALSNDPPDQDPVEGSIETAERNLAWSGEDGQPSAESVAGEPANRLSSAGSEAGEPSPER